MVPARFAGSSIFFGAPGVAKPVLSHRASSSRAYPASQGLDGIAFSSVRIDLASMRGATPDSVADACKLFVRQAIPPAGTIQRSAMDVGAVPTPADMSGVAPGPMVENLQPGTEQWPPALSLNI
jgi:hypothetical protein